MTAETDLITRWRKSIEFYETLRYGAAVDAGVAYKNKSLLQLTTEFEAMLGGTVYDGVKQDMFATRGRVAAALKLGAEATFQRHVFDYKEIDAADLVGDTFDVLWPSLFRYFAENSRRVKSRGFVFGVPTADAGNIGDGFVARCNYDAWGHVLESQWPDAKLLRCERDFSLGTNIGEEEFSIRSTTVKGRDRLEEEGSGKVGESNLVGITARSTQQNFGILNPSFTLSTPEGPTADPTDLAGWDSNVTISTTNYEVVAGGYRPSLGNPTPLALRCKATAFILSQTIPNPKFLTDRPYHRHIVIRRKNNADGTAKFRLGRHEITVNLATLTNDVWYVFMPYSTDTDVVDDKLGGWVKNFGEADIALEFERSGGTTGEVDLGEVAIGEFQPFDGSYYAILGGEDAFRIEDEFTFTDAVTAAVEGVNQKWFWRVLGLYLPAIPAKPVGLIAGALAGLGAGNVDNGSHQYAATYVDVNGIESGINNLIAVNVVDKTVNGQVAITGIPVGPANITKRKLYRNVAGSGSAAALKLLATINDNVTTTYNDNTADAGLGATIATVQINGTTLFEDP